MSSVASSSTKSLPGIGVKNPNHRIVSRPGTTGTGDFRPY